MSEPAPEPRVRAAGDAAVVLEFGPALDARIDPATVARVQRLDAALAAVPIEGLLERVPTFRSIALVLDPSITTPSSIAEAALAVAAAAEADSAPTPIAPTAPRTWRLPVRYGGEHGADLVDVAERLGIAPEELIERHAGTVVSVYLLGFLPGFAFLGPTDARLDLPRRREPRLRVPAGTVAIAGGLTAVYPWESPGGWHLIGHCPLVLFDPQRARPTLFEAGDRVRFEPIDDARLLELQHARAAGTLAAEDHLERDGARP